MAISNSPEQTSLQIGVSRPPLPLDDLPTPEEVFKVQKIGGKELFMYVVDPAKFKSARNANELVGSSANRRTLGTLSVSVGVPRLISKTQETRTQKGLAGPSA
jgi:hypothetical protein